MMKNYVMQQNRSCRWNALLIAIGLTLVFLLVGSADLAWGLCDSFVFLGFECFDPSCAYSAQQRLTLNGGVSGVSNPGLGYGDAKKATKNNNSPYFSINIPYPNAQLRFLYAATDPVKVYCGSNEIASVASSSGDITAPIDFSASDCGSAGTTIGNVTITFTGEFNNQTHDYGYFDNIEVYGCPSPCTEPTSISSVSFSSSPVDEGGTSDSNSDQEIQGTVTVDKAPSSNLNVTIIHNDTDNSVVRSTFSGLATINANATSATFTIPLEDDGDASPPDEGDQTVRFTAEATNTCGNTFSEYGDLVVEEDDVSAPSISLSLTGPTEMVGNTASGNFTITCSGDSSTTLSVNVTAAADSGTCNTSYNPSPSTVSDLTCDGSTTKTFTINPGYPGGTDCQVKVTVTNSAGSEADSVVVPLCQTAGCSGSSTGGGGDLRFGDGSGNTVSMLVLGEDGACAVGSQTVQICLPGTEKSGSNPNSSTFTLTKGSDSDGLITISPTTITLTNDKNCADTKFTVTANNSDTRANTYHDIPIMVKMTSSTNLTPSNYNDAQLTVRVLDDELDRSMWSWELDENPVSKDTDQRIEGRIKIKSEILPYLCRADFNTTDEIGSTKNAFTDSSSPSYFVPADYPECATATPYYCLCSESTWKLKWENLCYDSSTEALKERSACVSGDTMLIGLTTDGDGSEVAIVRYDDNTSGGATPFDLSDDRRIPDELPIVAIGNKISSAAEGTCRPAFCIISNNDYPTGQFPSCEGNQPPGATFYYPTFVMTASYDWLHNFYDNNASAATGTASLTDPDTDNFNKIIAIDSNLFPIHTAMMGDQEFPNIVMRNWTSRGAGSVARTSPSANDYINRSVAAVANFIPEERTILYDYGQTDGIKAKGLRSHLEWVYALDPANNNFRRYKFIKTADTIATYAYNDDGSNVQDMSGKCLTGDAFTCETKTQGSFNCQQGCNEDYWSVFPADEILLNSCSDADDWADYDPDEMYITYPKKQDSGMTGQTCPDAPASPSPTAANTPGLNLRVYFPAEGIVGNSGTVSVTLSLEGLAHDSSAELRYVLNPNSTDSNCIFSTRDTAGGDFTRGLNPNSACPNASGKNFNQYSRTFGSVPASCAQQDSQFPEFYYMEFSVFPCKNHGGWLLRLPEPPGPVDKGFQIPTLEDTDPTTWATMDATARQASINNRWADLGNYLDTMPPESYLGYPSYTAVNIANRTVGYGFQSNTSFTTGRNVRFRNPRDIDAYRDYFDVDNEGPTYIFVADTMNSRVQVFMNATGVAGDVAAGFPIRPVKVKGPNDNAVAFKTNELAVRLNDGTTANAKPGDGRKADWRHYTTVAGTGSMTNNAIPANGGRGEFFYPHGLAVDQDPDTKDVYLFVADTYNHRIQVFRDHSGVTNHGITNKKFDFAYETGWGGYNFSTPGPFSYRYPKGLDLVRFGNNSSYLYVVDSKNYRVMKYEVIENPAGGISSVTAKSGYGYDGSASAFATNLLNKAGTQAPDGTGPGFREPQDVATGYSGFFIANISGTEQMVFLNNNMVYVSDYARNDAATTDALVNMRLMQFIDIPGQSSPVQNIWIPWGTETVDFGTYTDDNLDLGQSPYGLYGGVHNSSGFSSNNVPSTSGTSLFSERPVGIATLQWNTLKPIDIRVVPESSGPADSPTNDDAYEPVTDTLPRDVKLRIGVSSRVQRFGSPVDKAKSFWNASSVNAPLPRAYGRWDGMLSGRVHFFCYNSDGTFSEHTALYPYSETGEPYNIQLDQVGGAGSNKCPANGFVKIVAEDKDFGYSGRSGTAYFKLGN